MILRQFYLSGIESIQNKVRWEKREKVVKNSEIVHKKSNNIRVENCCDCICNVEDQETGISERYLPDDIQKGEHVGGELMQSAAVTSVVALV